MDVMLAYKFATDSRQLAGSLTTVRGGKVFGRRRIVGTFEEAVFRLVLQAVQS